MIDALLKEIEIFDWATTSTPAGEEVETVYLGGGTPSLLTPDELSSLIAAVSKKFRLHPAAEVTIETNPDDISATQLAAWQQIGINRLSIGVQSFYDEDLQWMNRAHNARQSMDALKLARSIFSNITIDLIYGTPGLTDEKWEHNVRTALALDIPHLSCYALTVEPKTPLQKMIALQQVNDVNPDKQSEQFMLLMEWLEAAGYEHYEISNFAKPGFHSRHNSSYWQGKTYIGFGPSAHSFDGNSRWWNVANNNKYIESLKQGILPVEKELLSAADQLNEYLMISLRTSGGASWQQVAELTRRMDDSASIVEKLRRKMADYVSNGTVVSDEVGFRLTKEGKLLADGIAGSLFV